MLSGFAQGNVNVVQRNVRRRANRCFRWYSWAEMARILVVDDDRELVELLREYLEGEGLEVSEANDGTRGVAVALEGKVDLVVLDVMLPELNGFDVLRRIREQSRCR